MRGDCTVGHGGHDLTERLCTNVTDGKYAGDRRFRRFIGDNIARSIERKLTEKLRRRLSANADE